MVPLKVDTSGNITSEGPPTPTHSETQDCIDARKCKFNHYLMAKINFYFILNLKKYLSIRNLLLI